MECVPCGKKFSGEVPYQQHLVSEKHKKKVYSYALLHRQGDASSALNDKSIAADLHKTFHCSACDILFTSPEQFQWHSLTQEHAKKVISGTPKSTLNSDVVSSTDSKIFSSDESTDQKMDDVRKEDKSVDTILDEFDGNKNHLKLPFYNKCEDCNKQFSGPEPYRQHIESANHLKMVEMKKPTYQNVPFVCEICNKVFTGKIPYDQHMISEVHRKKMQQIKFCEKNTSVTDSSSGMPVLKTEENTLKIVNGDTIICSICNVPCSGAIPYEQHLNGATHLKNVNRAQQKNTFFPSANPLQPVTQLNNGDCSISGMATNQPHLGKNMMETDYILPELAGGINFMSCEELQKSIKFFKSDESIDFDFDISETKMDVDAANGSMVRDSSEEAKIELKTEMAVDVANGNKVGDSSEEAKFEFEGKQMNEIEENSVDSSNDKKANDILENTETEAKGKQMDGTERSPKVCDLCGVKLFNADDVAKHYESVEHFSKRWRSN